MRGLLILNLLILSVSSSHGKIICEHFGTYYTFCDRGYSCCFNNEYCCENSVVIHHVTNQTSLTGGVIAAIVISSIVLVILLCIIARFAYTRCNKDKRTVQGEVIQVQPGVSAIPMQNYGSPPQVGQNYPGAADEGLYGGPIFPEQNKKFPISTNMELAMAPQYHAHS